MTHGVTGLRLVLVLGMISETIWIASRSLMAGLKMMFRQYLTTPMGTGLLSHRYFLEMDQPARPVECALESVIARMEVSAIL